MDLEEQIWAEKCFIWKVGFFQKNWLSIGPLWRIRAEIGQKLARNWILGKYWSIFKFGSLINKGSDGVMVSTLNSNPANHGSIPLVSLKFFLAFLFFLVILRKKYSFINQKVQNSTQKLFVQFHYFKLFMYAYITYNEKKESKGLGHLLLITIIFLTMCCNSHSLCLPKISLNTQYFSNNFDNASNCFWMLMVST